MGLLKAFKHKGLTDKEWKSLLKIFCANYFLFLNKKKTKGF